MMPHQQKDLDAKIIRKAILALLCMAASMVLVGCSSTSGEDIEISDRKVQPQFLITKKLQRGKKTHRYVDLRFSAEKQSGLSDKKELTSGYINFANQRIDGPATLQHEAGFTRTEVAARLYRIQKTQPTFFYAGANINHVKTKATTRTTPEVYSYSLSGTGLGVNAGVGLRLNDLLTIQFTHHTTIIDMGADTKESQLFLRWLPVQNFAINAGFRNQTISHHSSSDSDVHLTVKGPWLGLELPF